MNPTEPTPGAQRPSHPQLFEAAPGTPASAQSINILASIDKRAGSQASNQSSKRSGWIWALCALPVMGIAALLWRPSTPSIEPMPISKVKPSASSAVVASAPVVTPPPSGAVAAISTNPSTSVPASTTDTPPAQVAKVVLAPAQIDTPIVKPKAVTTKHVHKASTPKAVALKKPHPTHLAKHNPQHDPKHKDEHPTQVAKAAAQKTKPKPTDTKVALKTPTKPAKPQPPRTPEADVDLLASLLPHVNRPQSTATTRTSLVAQLCEQLTGQEQIDCRIEYCKNRKGEDSACSPANLQPAVLVNDK